MPQRPSPVVQIAAQVEGVRQVVRDNVFARLRTPEAILADLSVNDLLQLRDFFVASAGSGRGPFGGMLPCLDDVFARIAAGWRPLSTLARQLPQVASLLPHQALLLLLQANDNEPVLASPASDVYRDGCTSSDDEDGYLPWLYAPSAHRGVLQRLLRTPLSTALAAPALLDPDGQAVGEAVAVAGYSVRQLLWRLYTIGRQGTPRVRLPAELAGDAMDPTAADNHARLFAALPPLQRQLKAELRLMACQLRQQLGEVASLRADGLRALRLEHAGVPALPREAICPVFRQRRYAIHQRSQLERVVDLQLSVLDALEPLLEEVHRCAAALEARAAPRGSAPSAA